MEKNSLTIHVKNEVYIVTEEWNVLHTIKRR